MGSCTVCRSKNKENQQQLVGFLNANSSQGEVESKASACTAMNNYTQVEY